MIFTALCTLPYTPGIYTEVPAIPEHVQISDENLRNNIAKSMPNDSTVKETQNVKEAIQNFGRNQQCIKIHR